MQPWQRAQQAQQQALQAQQAARQQQQLGFQNTRSRRPRSAAAGCAQALFWIVVLAIVAYLVYTLVIVPHLGL
jgi:anti-sigma-K factor RskA